MTKKRALKGDKRAKERANVIIKFKYPVQQRNFTLTILDYSKYYFLSAEKPLSLFRSGQIFILCLQPRNIKMVRWD